MALAGCGARASETPTPREYTGPIVESTRLVPDFLWQQEITAFKGPFSHSFPAAVQSADGVLTVLGLTPFRTRAFVIQQTGKDFEYEVYVEQKVALEPSWVLIDIHRTFFDGVPRRAPADGTYETLSGAERRVDRWQGGRLRSRSYSRRGAPTEQIRIEYGAGYRWGEPPARVTFDNGWYGYRLEVVTSSATVLPSAVAPPSTAAEPELTQDQ